jgi:hypothetical protein
MVPSSEGWKFLVPDPMPNRFTVIDCRTALHGNFWTLSVMVYPQEGQTIKAPLIENHWARTFSWTASVAYHLTGRGFPWEMALRGLRTRARASALILNPLFQEILRKVTKAKDEISGEVPLHNHATAGFSSVRLKPGFVGLTESSSDRRPYIVVSVAPRAAESPEYLEQVLLHESVHIVVASTGAVPHNQEFHQLAGLVGLKTEFRD